MKSRPDGNSSLLLPITVVAFSIERSSRVRASSSDGQAFASAICLSKSRSNPSGLNMPSMNQSIELSSFIAILPVANVAFFMRDVLAQRIDWPMLVRPDIVVLAVGFSALVGIGFGMYPAHKASRLDPIDALRYE